MSLSVNNLKATIITVCLNSEKFIDRCIRSVLYQTYKNTEYIIIDGGSTDSTLQIISKYKKYITNYVSQPDKGIYDAHNKGIKLASGDIFCLLNSDDLFYDRNVVVDIVRCFIQNPQTDFIYGNMLCSYPHTSKFKLKKYPGKLRKSFFLKDTLGHSATFFKRQVFVEAGYYDIRYQISADYEWYLRALYKKGLKGSYFNRTLSIFHTGGISGDRSRFQNEIKDIQNIYFSSLERLCFVFADLIFHGRIFVLIAKFILGEKNVDILKDMYWNKIVLKQNQFS